MAESELDPRYSNLSALPEKKGDEKAITYFCHAAVILFPSEVRVPVLLYFSQASSFFSPSLVSSSFKPASGCLCPPRSVCVNFEL